MSKWGHPQNGRSSESPEKETKRERKWVRFLSLITSTNNIDYANDDNDNYVKWVMENECGRKLNKTARCVCVCALADEREMEWASAKMKI